MARTEEVNRAVSAILEMTSGSRPRRPQDVPVDRARSLAWAALRDQAETIHDLDDTERADFDRNGDIRATVLDALAVLERHARQEALRGARVRVRQ